MENEKYTMKDFIEDLKCVLVLIGAFVALFGCLFLCSID